jgi:hypothetical protein
MKIRVSLITGVIGFGMMTGIWGETVSYAKDPQCSLSQLCFVEPGLPLHTPEQAPPNGGQPFTLTVSTTGSTQTPTGSAAYVIHTGGNHNG